MKKAKLWLRGRSFTVVEISKEGGKYIYPNTTINKNNILKAKKKLLELGYDIINVNNEGLVNL